MPELPEVETLRRGLERGLVGKRITAVSVSVNKLLKPPVTDPTEFALGLVGRRVLNASRRGKHLILALDSGYALAAHLKMRGQMLIVPSAGTPVAPYLCLAFDLDDGSQWRFHDMWTWGEIRLLPDNTAAFSKYVPALSKMGMEPLSEHFSGNELMARAGRRAKSKIKAGLLDQEVVAGVGNIYADEALYRAGIRPERKIEAITPQEWDRLAKSIVLVLNEAIEGGGTASDSFVDWAGTVGRYTPQVYARADKPCVNCSTRLTRVKVAGRSSVYCSSCQT